MTIYTVPQMLRILKDISHEGPVTPEPFSKKLENIAPEEAARLVIEMTDKVCREAGLA